jgi:hypothetical protein
MAVEESLAKRYMLALIAVAPGGRPAVYERAASNSSSTRPGAVGELPGYTTPSSIQAPLDWQPASARQLVRIRRHGTRCSLGARSWCVVAAATTNGVVTIHGLGGVGRADVALKSHTGTPVRFRGLRRRAGHRCSAL